MQSKDLLTVWSSPDNTRLTAKQFSFRLPVHVAAKLAALCEMYPQRTRTQIVADLLSTALADVEAAFPKVEGHARQRGPDSDSDLIEDIGPGTTYRRLANRHYAEIERELGNVEQRPLYEHPNIWIVADAK